jgi:three-Cys-motif partner protein
MSRLGSEGEDVIGRWSEEKLDLLAKYLNAYSVIMNEQKRKWLGAYNYVDAFAGSVRPRAKEDELRYIDGSPIRALQTEPPFDGYWFIDVDPQRIARVGRLREQFPDCLIETRLGDCNEVLCGDIIPHVLRAKTQRSFVFLDPYGLQVNWETVRELANTETCDIFINFSVMGVTRFLPKNQSPDPEVIEQINKVMGSTDWINQIYRESPGVQLPLFGESADIESSRDTIQARWLADLYTEQLRSVFPHVSKPVLMRNSTNSVLYALCLASHNGTAIKITNDIFKRYEKLRNL